MSENLRVDIQRDVFTRDHLIYSISPLSSIKVNIYENYLYINLF